MGFLQRKWLDTASGIGSSLISQQAEQGEMTKPARGRFEHLAPRLVRGLPS
jgi:hypothetical protein